MSNDTLRSLAISQQLLGTKEVFIIHHTNCGAELQPLFHLINSFFLSNSASSAPIFILKNFYWVLP